MSINDPQQNISVKITFYFSILKQSILDFFWELPSWKNNFLNTHFQFFKNSLFLIITQLYFRKNWVSQKLDGRGIWNFYLEQFCVEAIYRLNINLIALAGKFILLIHLRLLPKFQSLRQFLKFPSHKNSLLLERKWEVITAPFNKLDRILILFFYRQEPFERRRK